MRQKNKRTNQVLSDTMKKKYSVGNESETKMTTKEKGDEQKEINRWGFASFCAYISVTHWEADTLKRIQRCHCQGRWTKRTG